MNPASPEQFDGCVRLLMQSSNDGGRQLLADIEEHHGNDVANRVRAEARSRFDAERARREAPVVGMPRKVWAREKSR